MKLDWLWQWLSGIDSLTKQAEFSLSVLLGVAALVQKVRGLLQRRWGAFVMGLLLLLGAAGYLALFHVAPQADPLCSIPGWCED